MRHRESWRLAAAVRLIAGVGLLVTAGGAARAEIIDRVMAVVAGRLILLSDVRGFQQWPLGFVQERGQGDTARVVDHLIERELILAEVERYALPNPDGETVDARIETLRQRSGPDAFQKELAAVGWSADHLRRVLRDNVRIEQYLDERFTAAVAPTDAEALDYYRQHSPDFVRDGQLQPFESVRELIRERLSDRWRRELIETWIAGLRRRADITRLDQPTGH